MTLLRSVKNFSGLRIEQILGRKGIDSPLKRKANILRVTRLSTLYRGG